MMLKAFTLIETLVTLVILSIIFTLTTIIAFNYYRSIPAWSELKAENELKRMLDSLVISQRIENYQSTIGRMEFLYECHPSTYSEKVFIAHGILRDSSNQIEQQEILIIDED